MTASTYLAATGEPGSTGIHVTPGPVPDAGTVPFDPDVFRSVFRRHAAGVAVITARGASPVGFTATSLTSVAAEPPLLSFAVGTGSSSWPTLAAAAHVGV